MKWQYREIGEGGWIECSKEKAEALNQSPLHDTRKEPYEPVDLPRDIRASQLPPRGKLFWAMVVVTILWVSIGFWLCGMA